MITSRRRLLSSALQIAGASASALAVNAVGRSAAVKGRTLRPEPEPLGVQVESRGWPKLIAHWKMDGDCGDAVGAHPGEGHGIKFVEGRDGKPQGAAQFNGVDSFIEVAEHEELNLETREFSVALWVNLPENIESAHGDILTKYDGIRRKGFNLSVTASSPSYGSMGDAKNLHFGIDNAINGSWLDCGRPWKSNPLVSTLTVYKGDLYTGIADASKPEDACHVFRYAGGTDWVDCGRVGTNPLAVSVFSMIVHKGHLYAGTGVWDWDRAHAGIGGPNHVYRYAGGARWEDCGQFGNGYRTMALVSFKGDLYAGDDEVRFYRYEGNQKWSFCGQVAPSSEILFDAATVYQGHIYGSTHPGMYRYDGGTNWACIGHGPHGITQNHKLQVYEGRLYAGTWPQGKVLRYEGGDLWTECGQLGIPDRPIPDQRSQRPHRLQRQALCGRASKSGSLPLSAIPDGTSTIRPGLCQKSRAKAKLNPADVHTWFRAPSLTQFQDLLYVGTSTCFGRYDPEVPPEAGRVHSMRLGRTSRMTTISAGAGSTWRRSGKRAALSSTSTVN